MKFKTLTATVVFFCSCLLIGCASTGHDKVIAHKNVHYSTIDMIFIDLKPLENVNVALEGLGYDGNMIAQSMHQANFNASMQAGYNAQTGLAGALIGGMIVKEAQINREIKEKNSRVQGFLNDLKQQNWKMHWRSVYTEPAKVLVFSDDPSQLSLERKLHITPILQVAADYQSLHMIVEAEVINPNGKSEYRNYFYLQSEALLEKNESLMQLSFKDRQWFEETLVQMLNPLPQLIKNELASEMKAAKPSEPIRFINGSGEYYERGYLLGYNEGYITFRTLRGEVKHYPFEKLL